MKRTLILIITLLMVLPGVNSQENQPASESLDDGNFFYNREDYKEAVFHYLKLDGTKLINANIYYKIGICYLNINSEEAQAIPFLQEAIKDISPKYKKNSDKETHAPEYAYYYLGNAYRINNELEKALGAYYKFKNLPDFENKFNLEVLNNEIKACEKAKIIQDIPINIKLTNVGSPINSSVSNFNPVLSSDETIMIFMKELKFYNGIFMSVKEAGIWQEPENITPQVGSDGDVLPTFLSSNGLELYLVKGEGNSRDLYVSTFDGQRWSIMKSLNSNINSDKAETHASTSVDGTSLYFTSNRKGGFGELDIYRATREKDGTWGKATNMGNVINTPFNEEAPFISMDNSTLFFSSQGHYTMGGYDIFYSIIENDKWGTPINIGYPINTTGNDLFYFPIGNGLLGYIPKVMDDGFGKDDIYRVEIIPDERTKLAAERGAINMNGKSLTHSKNFEILIKDKATGQVTGTIYLNKNTGKLYYISKTGNMSFTYREKD